MLTSDARTRFERGVDPAFLDDGLAIATRLVLDLCGGTASEVTRAGDAAERGQDGRLTIPRWPRRWAGSRSRRSEQKAILESARLRRRRRGLAAVTVPPSWRRDVDGPADLVEEVIRIDGIDNVPSTPLPRAPGVARPPRRRSRSCERKLRRTAAARGLNEAVTWSFISEAEAAAFGGGAWTLANPISEDMKVMRPSLLPGLLAAAERNLEARRDERSPVRDRPPLSRRRRASDARRAVLAGDARAARLGRAARRSPSTPSTPRPRRWRCSTPRARRSPTCK